MSRKLISSCVLLLLAAAAFGQTAKSTFSSVGIGDMVDPVQANVQGMGGVGVSNPQFWYMNNLNPALMVFNRFTTFQAGVVGEARTASNGTLSQKSRDGNMNYLMVGFPMRLDRKHPSMTRWSMGLSLTPYTMVNYGFSYNVPVENSPGTALFTEQGLGGINQLSWSHGIGLTEFLSVGLRANYFFSSIDVNNGKSVQLGSDQTTLLTSNTHERYNYSDYSLTGALSLHLDSLGAKMYRFNLGAVYNLDANIRTDYFETLERFNQAGIRLSTDTLVASRLGDTIIPGSLLVGMSFGKAETWAFGVDAKLSDFTDFVAFEKSATGLHRSWKVAAGLEVTPDPASISSFLKRLTYRTGVSLEEIPYLVNGNPVRDFGINFGLSAPVGRISSVDLGLRWGKRGNIEENTIEEQYFKIYFGITFNDRWFNKRRFD